MKIGVLKEIKIHEYRVALTPSGASSLVADGHDVYIEDNAGIGVGFSNQDYQKVGAKICSTQEVYKKCQLIVKVKEPLANEYSQLTSDHILFAYLHLAPDLEQTKGLLDSGCIAIAYETLTASDGSLPLLRPMSEIAGRMSIQAGAYALEKAHGGSGVLLSGVVGVEPAKVLVLGGGIVGLNAARIAMGIGAKVTITDISLSRLAQIELDFGPRLTTRFSTATDLNDLISEADLVIGAVLIPGASAPKIISRDMVKSMKTGSVIVDVAIDQGGSCETSSPTNHEKPTYIEENVVHYCVTNMPGAVAKTSTMALTNATLPYVKQLASSNIDDILAADKNMRNGLNIYRGHVANKAVADQFGYKLYDKF